MRKSSYRMLQLLLVRSISLLFDALYREHRTTCFTHSESCPTYYAVKTMNRLKLPLFVTAAFARHDPNYAAKLLS